MQRTSRYLTLLLAALSLSTSSAASASCQSVLGGSYSAAAATYPNFKNQIELIAKQQVAQWYTDRVSDVDSLAKSVVLPFCNDARQEANTPVIVVYGLPQKDCAHGFSTAGSNTNAADYRAFLQKLSDAAENRQVVYILEPDAVGLLADGACGNNNNYAANLGVAMDILSQNANAEMYLDVGYWTLESDEDAAAVAKIVNTVDPQCKCKGISLNTSNYRSNAEMATACERFVKATGKKYKCIVDTSRNYVAPASNEWCNANWAGIGELPSANTGSSLISRYVWLKPPGESDGQCSGQSDKALRGPNAGDFYPDHFVQLWDNGVFVQKLGMAPINGATNTSNSTAAAQQEVEITSLSAVDNDGVGTVHADDEWSEDDAQTPVPTTPAPTTPTPTTTAPVAVQVEAPHTMVVVDVTPDDEYLDENEEASFASADDDTNSESGLVRQHKACK
ncbi:hypothetical protein DVH05_000184 [Phytophthora capsici]|nr:hypothetical protein DVH05_000184 [Phytophthora capsici]|eukprot:jgi/Phyca11/556263/estExt2_Genewise1Plus.C_PHYCAscaffold_850066